MRATQKKSDRQFQVKFYFLWNRVKQFFWALFQKRSFSDAYAAASTLNILLYYFDKSQLEREINVYAQSFAYLLEPSSLYLEGKPYAYFVSVDTLHESWLYALDHEETHQLLELYQRLREVNKKPERALRQWIEYLSSAGLTRMDVQQETVRISSKVRKRYDNTLGLADGIEVEIELHPWCLGSNLLVSGMLKH